MKTIVHFTAPLSSVLHLLCQYRHCLSIDASTCLYLKFQNSGSGSAELCSNDLSHAAPSSLMHEGVQQHVHRHHPTHFERITARITQFQLKILLLFTVKCRSKARFMSRRLLRNLVHVCPTPCLQLMPLPVTLAREISLNKFDQTPPTDHAVSYERFLYHGIQLV